MPTTTTWVTPELFKVIRGVKVFHTYKDDDMDQGTNTLSFTLNPDSDDDHFDLRELDVPAKKLLDSHPPFKTVTDPVWSQADAAARAKIDRDWDEWFASGQSEAIAIIIEEALAAGLLQSTTTEVVSAENATAVADESGERPEVQAEASAADHAILFMEELLDSVATLTSIAEEYGARTLADLLYLQSAILQGGFIDSYPESSHVAEIAMNLPSGERWMTFIKDQYLAQS